MTAFRERYGPFALVAGASAGLGAAFARALAARGLDLLLLARRAGPLEALAAELRAAHRVEVRVAAADLGAPELLERVERLAAGAEVGLLVYNAAASAIGPFLDRPLEEQLRVLDVNCRGPLVLAHRLGGAMARRGRGGIVLMTSLAGGQGNPLLASYAASKAFNLVLAEGLWAELRAGGVDVVACRAGATRTPGYEASRPRAKVPLMEPEPVVEAALSALGRGPAVVAGGLNKLAAFAFSRLLPRRAAIRIMERATRRLYG
ncbi:MAG TPA: SDR family NAD(P)-dependent oxidoreductase [Anaeromyxobacter sp.]|nr:SDR family NAD(P)-dependent oxidoreductase [Anaeromyxobacter sp.]